MGAPEAHSVVARPFVGSVPTLLLVLSLILSGAVVAFPQESASIATSAVPAQVYMAPNPLELGLIGVYDLRVAVDNVVDLHAVQLRITFPNGLVQVQDADPAIPGTQIRDGNIFDGLSTFTIINNADNARGVIEYTRSVNGNVAHADGSGVIAYIPFSAVALGDGTVAFVEAILLDPDGREVPTEVTVGQVQVRVVQRTSTPTRTTVPAATPTISPPTATATLVPGACEVRIVPVTQDVAVGGTVLAEIQVRNAHDLYWFDFRMDYNGARLDVVDASEPPAGVQVAMGNVFDSFSYLVLANEVSDDGVFGQVHLSAFISDGSPLGFDGNATLGWVTLRGVETGLSSLVLSSVTLLDHNGTTIPRGLSHGQVNIVSVVPSASPSPSTTATRTMTPSTTATASVTPTPTSGPSRTPSPTTTRTLTASPTAPLPTGTRTPGATPTVTPTVRPGVCEVRVIPSSQLIATGNGTIVQLLVLDVADLYSFDLRLDYDGAKLDVQDAAEPPAGVQVHMGDVFDSFASYEVLDNAVSDDGTLGQVHFSAFINDGSPLGFSGAGVLAWIEFRGVASGISNLTLSSVTLLDHHAVGISRELLHGQIAVVLSTSTPILPTPTTTRTPTRTATPGPTATTTATPTGTLPTPTRSATAVSATATATTSATLTLTPSATATVVVPTPTPICSNLIQNGSFETLTDGEAPPWVRSGNPIFVSEHNNGVRSVRLGGTNNANDRIYQQVAVPSSSGPYGLVTRVTLRYWWGMVTEEVTHPHDGLTVCLRNTAGSKLQDIQLVNDSALLPQWRKIEADITSFAGQTLRVSFEAATDAINPTSFFIDDVELEVCEVYYSTPTATATRTLTPTATTTGTILPSATPLPSGTLPPSLTPTITKTPTITPWPTTVVLQYGRGGYLDTYDSYISSWEPTTNYGREGGMRIRTGNVKRPLLYFDVSSIPSGAVVAGARLWLRATWLKTHPQVMTVGAYGLQRAWLEEEVTWKDARNGVPWGQAGAEDTGSDRDAAPVGSRVVNEVEKWYDIDVTSLVQAWVNGTRANNGLILIPSGLTVEMSFWSSEFGTQDWHPKLVVDYHPGSGPGPTSTPLPTATPHATPVPTVSATLVVLQQNKDGYVGTDDTYISLWEPTTNNGSYVTMIVRAHDIRSSLVRFDLSSLPIGRTIVDAHLKLYCVRRSNTGAMFVELYPVLRPWAELQATWVLARLGDPWGMAGCDLAGVDRPAASHVTKLVTTSSEWHDWDVTGLVRSWVAAPSSNHGMLLRGTGTTAVEYVYATSEYYWSYSLAPQLAVRFAP